MTLVTLKDPEGRWLSRHCAHSSAMILLGPESLGTRFPFFFFLQWFPCVRLIDEYEFLILKGTLWLFFCLFVLRNNEKEELISKLNLVAGTHDQKPVGFPCFRLVSSTLFIFLYLFIYTRFGF